ncbi:MAG: CoA transferase [Aquisalinus sp.]|nr:CoA transferase [Aquisalinus sp.]
MGPLTGIKVVDLTTMVSGPVATMMLADQGAEVIKVEALQGEQMRHIGPPHNGVNSAYFSCNRGKQSLALDLKSEEGQAILMKLATEADVFVQNFRPGAIDRMGFAEEKLRKINEKLIFVSISGFGEEGPYSAARVYDPVIQALSGATDIQADRQTGRPQMFRIIIADKVMSLTAAQAISSALFHREKTGEGQHIRLSMLEAMLAFFWPEGMAGLTYAEQEFDARKIQGVMDLIYETEDRHITAGAVSDKEWKGMCRAIGREELIDDERFKTSAARFFNADERKRITAEEIKKWKSADILKRLEAEDVPCALLLNRDEILTHDQITSNESVLRINFPGFGEVRQARPAARFDKTPAEVRAPAPKLGEHTRKILADLGYDQSAQDTLIDDQTVIALD